MRRSLNILIPNQFFKYNSTSPLPCTTSRVAFNWPFSIGHFLTLTGVPRSGSRDYKHLFSSLGAGSSNRNSPRSYHPYFNFNRSGHLPSLMRITRSSSGTMASPLIIIAPLPSATNISSSARCAPSFSKAPTRLYLLNLVRKRWTAELAVPSTLYYDARFPARSQQFTASELRQILTQLHRPSVLRSQHFYPYETKPDFLPWFESSLAILLDRFLPPPGTGISSLYPLRFQNQFVCLLFKSP